MLETAPVVSRQKWLQGFALAAGYAVVFYLLQFYLHKIAIFDTAPTNANLTLWDAGWYRSIADEGYKYTERQASNSGFFPLIPWLWKLTGLPAFGMAALSTLAFATGFGLLVAMQPVSGRTQLLWLSVPTTYFMFIPYTEGFFFLFILLVLWGQATHRLLPVWVGLLLASLARATALVLLPAMLIAGLVAAPRKQWWQAVLYWLGNCVLPSAIGLGIFVLYQHRVTGVWFAYFKMQSQQWGRKFSWTTFPLSSMDGPRIFWLSCLAAFFLLAGVVLTVKAGVQWLAKNKPAPAAETLSAAYLMMIYLTVIFFNPTWGTNTTNVMGMFRYGMSNPFFFILLQRLTAGKQYRPKHYLIVFLLANVVWLSMGSYVHIQEWLFLNVNTLFIFLYMLWDNRKYGTIAGMLLFGINLLLQLHLFQHFISGFYSD